MSLQLSKRQQQRNEQILHGLLKEKGNSKCADCNAPNPSWASYNLGIFLCVRCAAIHRKIGTHISKIKSLTLDKWNPEQISTMRATGNTQSNEKYNPNHRPPPTTAFSGGDATEDIELERYIRDKYERKTFMKTTKKLPPSPSFHRDPDKITAILGPPAARSPSLGSSSSGNLKPGQRVSGESFERARSPASTNSSVELSTRHVEQDPWAWAGLETKSFGAMQTVYEGPSQGNGSTASLGNGNPFQSSLPLQPQPVPQPLPQVTPFPPPPRPNPFNLGETNFDPQRKETISQETQLLLNSASSPFQQPISNGPGSLQTVYPQSQQTVYPRSPIAQTAQISTPNPFVSPQVQTPSPMSPTNPFFASQPAPAPSPFTPVYQPQQQQPSYQSQPQQPQSLYQQPQPQHQPQQPEYQPQQPQHQPSQYQQPQYQQQPQPLYQQQQQQPQSQQPLYQSPLQHVQPQYQQYQPPFQPQPQPTSQPFNPNQPFASPRMDKQSILSLFNTQPQAQPQILNQNGVPAWTQQSNAW